MPVKTKEEEQRKFEYDLHKTINCKGEKTHTNDLKAFCPLGVSLSQTQDEVSGAQTHNAAAYKSSERTAARKRKVEVNTTAGRSGRNHHVTQAAHC